MKSKLLAILAVAITALFFSSQAYAWGSKKDKDMDKGKSSVYDTGGASKSSPTDRDIGNDEGSSKSNKSTDQLDYPYPTPLP